LLERRKRQSGILIEFAQFTNTVKYKNHLSINTHPRNCPKKNIFFTKNKDHYQVLTETGLVDGGLAF